MQEPHIHPIRWNPRKLVPYLVMHALAVVALATAPWSWGWLAFAWGASVFRMFWIVLGYHRYFSHRSFKTGRPFQFLLAWMANLSLMRGPLVWAAAHRYHHQHSDTESDLHSAVKGGFLWAHTFWFLTKRYDETPLATVRDLERFPELRWMDRHYYAPAYLYGISLALVGGWPMFAWGFLVSTILTWHATFTINSLCHVFGSRRYDTPDGSRNNFWLALLTLGEGWHNNHHHFMQSARQGFFWWEIDPTYYALKAFERVGLVWDIVEPPASALVRPSGAPARGRLRIPRRRATSASVPRTG